MNESKMPITHQSDASSSDLTLSGLKGKRVVITAGAGGIGLAIAELLNNHGVKLAICDVDNRALDEARVKLDNCIFTQADVSNDDQVNRFFDKIDHQMGGLDVLVNNAGITGPTCHVEDLSPEDWRRCIDVCLTGQFLCTRRAVPMIKASGGGSIINMSSAAGKHGYAYRTPYSAAKFGVIGFTQSLAKELGPDNIRVNAVLPGIVSGPRMEKVILDRANATGTSYETMLDEYMAKISMRRMVTVEDVAKTVAYLISDLASNVPGQSLAVDGNMEAL